MTAAWLSRNRRRLPELGGDCEIYGNFITKRFYGYMRKYNKVKSIK